MSQTIPPQQTKPAKRAAQGCCSDREQSDAAKRGVDVESDRAGTPREDEPAGSCCGTTNVNGTGS